MFNSGNAEMMVNISTNQPVFHVRGLSSGTEYRVKIYSVNDSGGVSEHAVFQTFTLQVNNQNYQYQLTFVSHKVLMLDVARVDKNKIG